jgi:chemosensory pili system protein ChpA (sensor histidine kinase/response regulator)
MPADEAARGELVQGMADLPGLFGAFFMSPQEEMGDLAGAMLTAIGQGQQAQVVGQSLTTLRDDLVPVAEDGLMILDAAGIDELLEQAIANGVPQSETVEQGEVVPEEAESHSAEAWSGQAGADEGGEAIDEGQAATAHEPPAPPAIEAATPPAEEQTPAAVEEEEPEVNPFSDETMELLGLLAAGVSESQEELENEAAHLATAESVSWESELRHYADILERVVMAAETIEFTALHGAASRMVEKIRSTPYPEEEGNRQQLSETLHAFPQVLLDFLAAPHKDAGLLALYASFEAAGAFDGLGDKERMDYLDGLSRGPADDEVQEEVPTVEAADLVLKPDSDADASVLESVAGEGPRLAGEFAQLLQQVIAGEEIEENLRKAQRTVHTLKGSANICGIRGIANLSHHLEDLLEHLGEKGEAPDDTLSEVLVDAADALESSLEVVFSGEEHDAKVFAEIVAKVVGWSYGIRHGLGEPVEVQLGEGVGVAEDPAESQAESAGKATSGAAQAAPSGDLVDGLQKQMGELSIALTQAESRIAAARQSLDQMVDQHLTNMRNVEKLEELADIRGLGTRFTNLFGGGEKASSDSYDPLEMEEYNELYITTRRLHEGEADAQALAEGLDQAIKVLEELSQIQLRLNHETQDLIAAARQVPVGQYIPRLQRVVRQTCRSTGKDAEMIVDGGELEVDNEVMEKLLPALLHILRNAIDHGVESAESRIAAGKPEEGRLSLSFNRVGNAIEVVFSDDGAGLDYDRVRRKAVKNGLIDESARLENRELALLTLKPGFSTQEQVSEISGRGVGMNVVDAAIRELKGALSIDSETGKGYTLTMRVPTSTISMYTLLVRIGEETFAIPGSEIKYAAPFADGEIVQEGGVDYFRYGEERYPLEELGYLIGQKRSSRDSERPIVLIAYSDVDERAVLADALTDSRMVIAKKLGDYVPPIPGVSSATILGDGSIVPILELRRLLRREGFVESLGAFEVADEDAIKAPGILIVDDSLSMRKSLSQLVVDGGFRALTATDGMDALRVVEEEMPDVVLVDMEMPHMNGLELTSHLRANAATNHLPIAMITSRATASHREKALDAGVDHYFIKPYKEDEVLEFIEQRLLARGSGGNDHD